MRSINWARKNIVVNLASKIPNTQRGTSKAMVGTQASMYGPLQGPPIPFPWAGPPTTACMAEAGVVFERPAETETLVCCLAPKIEAL